MRRVVYVLLLAISPAFGAQPLPYYPHPAEAYLAEDDAHSSAPTMESNLVRIKIGAFSNGKRESQVRLGGLVVCSDSACYKPVTTGYVDLEDTLAPAPTKLADFMIPPTTITSVYFTEVVGGSIVEGNLKLKSPLTVEKGFYGGEILLILSKKGNGKMTSYVPVQSATALLPREGATTVYYTPGNAVVKQLPLGVTFKLPKGALSEPTIFNISSRDVGAEFPLIDIYPYLDLRIPASLETTRIVRAASSVSNRPVRVPSPPPPNMRGISSRLNPMIAAAKPSKVNLALNRTGVVNSHNFESATVDGLVSQPSIASTSGVSQCLTLLNDPSTLGLLDSYIGQNGVVNVNWCENSPPYIHIKYISLEDPRIKFRLLTQEVDQMRATLALKTITEFSPYAITAVNGATWQGDEGVYDNEHGFANYWVETMWSKSVDVGTNRTVGGHSPAGTGVDYYPEAGPVFGMSWASVNYASSTAATGPYNVVFGMSNINSPNQPPPFAPGHWNATVSTTTSVVRDGVCQTPGGESRWSAVGANHRRMVMVSSTSSGTTSAAELCPVFKALGINNALRLDGGPSAAMIMDGVVSNPLTGLYWIKYGNLRRIAYPLNVGW